MPRELTERRRTDLGADDDLPSFAPVNAGDPSSGTPT
jgi:hypothetical protein